MLPEQEPYRVLHEALLSYDRDTPWTHLLAPWLERYGEERRWLDTLCARTGRLLPPMTADESMRLYALSRIVELLQLSLAPRTAEHAWDPAPVSRDEHARFMDALGLERIDRGGFHPFFHEVVVVDQTEDDGAAPEVVEEFWPGYMLGSLLVTRAGCRVRAGRRHLDKPVAERSTLYWAYARNGRPTEDLGLGWGGNSQWRTQFRRDYLLDGVLHYNVAPAASPPTPDPDLGPAETLELVRHRCFVTTALPSGDRWPYGIRHVEPL